MNFTEAFIVIVMVFIVAMFIRQHYNEVEMVPGGDGRRYIVRNLPDSKKAAETLASISATLQKLIAHMQDKFPDDAGVKQLAANFNPDAISEGGSEVGFTSYSVNKGEKIVLCVRQPDNSFVDMNTLIYVAVHELAHLMTDEVGHTDKFWANFKRLITEAIDIGMYTKVDFKNHPQPYCGINITSSVV